jgi:hypothetical protein
MEEVFMGNKYRSRKNPEAVADILRAVEDLNHEVQAFESLAKALGILIENVAKEADPDGNKVWMEYFELECLASEVFQINCVGEHHQIANGNFTKRTIVFQGGPKKQITALKKLFSQMGFRVGQWNGRYSIDEKTGKPMPED